MAETRAETIAIGIAHQPGFAVDDLNCPFGTSRRAEPAAGTFVLVNPNDISHGHLNLLDPEESLKLEV
jgi:hypothetical protein